MPASLAYWLLFVWSASAWYAGWSFGPRLLVPVLGWAAIPVAVWAHEHRTSPVRQGLLRGAIVAGIAYQALVQVTFPEPPPEARNPVIDFVLPALDAGLVAPNLGGTFFGLEGLAGLVPLLVLLAVVMGLVLVHGVRRFTFRQRVAVALSAMLFPLLLAGAVQQRGRTWSASKQEHFIDWLERLSESEPHDGTPEHDSAESPPLPRLHFFS